MTEKLAECSAVTSGAHFYRGDLHIHSYGGSHEVKDAGVTSQAIIATVVAEDLDIIAIANDNEIFNVRAAMEAMSAAGLLVIPVVELSTPKSCM
ncbi:hypothetical protein [Pseudomonas sp.]|uniref:hypothetical protein n=1 Tax=Pseudomonas sp. TaxID=306 RepID=UPI002620127A|nr:hypothetical protein [Pseudomonas sp.]